MRERLNLEDRVIMDPLRKAYELQIAQVEFLPIGADINALKYRIETNDSAVYFLKVRKGSFEEISVVVPHFLYQQGISQVISPLKTKDNQLWINLDGYTCILYPYIEGYNGFEVELTGQEWIDFGAALQNVHSLILPPGLQGVIPYETYSPYWRDRVKEFQAQVEYKSYADPVANKMAAFLRMHRDEIHFMMERAEQLGNTLQAQSLKQVLCHSDIHAGNLLHNAKGALYIIDWDNPILAPKERDLMFIGGGVGGIWNSTSEDGLFYQGYGEKEVNLTALAYYRYERIIEDFAAYSEQFLVTGEGGAERERTFQKFTRQFLPNQVIEIAYQTDQLLRKE